MRIDQQFDRVLDLVTPISTVRVLRDIAAERERQNEKWGMQLHPDGTSRDQEGVASMARWICDCNARDGNVTWRDILAEETCEAYAQEDPEILRNELIQVAAVAAAWIEDIDSRDGT